MGFFNSVPAYCLISHIFYLEIFNSNQKILSFFIIIYGLSIILSIKNNQLINDNSECLHKKSPRCGNTGNHVRRVCCHHCTPILSTTHGSYMGAQEFQHVPNRKHFWCFLHVALKFSAFFLEMHLKM